MNKTAWKNRILALLLAVFMTVGVFPVQAFAEDDSPVVVVPETQQTEVADGTDKQLAGEDEQDNKAEDTDKDTEEKPADSSDTANESEEDDTTKPAEDTDIQSGDIPDEKDKDADHEQKDAAEEHSETLDGKEAAKSEESSDAEDPSDGKESSDAEKPSDDQEASEAEDAAINSDNKDSETAADAVETGSNAEAPSEEKTDIKESETKADSETKKDSEKKTDPEEKEDLKVKDDLKEKEDPTEKEDLDSKDTDSEKPAVIEQTVASDEVLDLDGNPEDGVSVRISGKLPEDISVIVQAPNSNGIKKNSPVKAPARPAKAPSKAPAKADIAESDDTRSDDEDASVSDDTSGTRTIISYDITLTSQGAEYQPQNGPVSVTIEHPAIAQAVADGSTLEVWHIADDSTRTQIDPAKVTVEGSSITFEAEGFSVYEIVEAKPYPVVVESTITSPSQIEADQGYRLSIVRSGTNYMTTTETGVNSAAGTDKGEFIGTQEKGVAGIWYFESAGASGQYYIYCKDGSTNKYLYAYSAYLIELNEVDKTAFTVQTTSNNVGTFYIYTVINSKNYALSVRGIRNFFLENRDNGANNNERVIITTAFVIPDDYYELNGKSFGIAYHEENIKGAGLTSNVASNKLNAVELLVRPDVLNSTGELLIAKDSDLTEWTFTFIEGNKYYVTTKIGGTTYYLTLGNNISLETAPNANSVINVESGTGEYSGKYRFSGASKSLTLSGGKVSGGFTSASNGGDYSWLNLVTKSELLNDDDFTIYSAEKVDLSDRTEVPDGAKIVLYTRKWNDTKKKYEFYAVNYDGSLARAFESGAMVQWVGSTINTMVWEFTEYLDTNGDPNYYYQLKNTYPGGASSNCIRPADSGTFLRTEGAYPNPFDRSINLNGRRYGYYYSTILAWDDESYAYIGLRVKDDCSGIEVCPMGEADTFYFAMMVPTPDPMVPDSTTVETIDHTQYGITMKMVDFSGKNEGNNVQMSTFLGSSVGGAVTTTVPNLLSTDLGPDGYPKNSKGKSLLELFNAGQGLNDVNNLFIKNTYFSSGYYEFDSAQNFASFYDKNGDLHLNNFTVYNELGTNDVKASNSMKHGQFLPYNALSNSYSVKNPYNLYDATLNELPDSDPRKWEQLRLVSGTTDYHFAMEIEASFTQTPNGHDAWGHDIIYEFTGDDDFWLYVDGELVIDLGGIHSALAGSVNFSTGTVVVNGVSKTLKQVFTENFVARYKAANGGSSPTQQQINDFLAEKHFEETENIFKEYTDHTMRIFFMERGAGASNLHMRFNLASVKPGTVLLSKEIKGVDSTESYMSEYPFQIFYKESDAPGAIEYQLVTASDGSGIRVVYKDTNRFVKLIPSYTAPDGAEYNHVFMLQPGETAEVDFPDSAMVYYIKECAVDITTVDNSTNPATTTHQGIYLRVTVNNDEISGVPNGKGKGRQDFSIPYANVDGRGRVIFQNWVDPNAKGTLTFVKHLYAEDGTTQILHADNDTTFTFRLYLGTENTPADALPLADMYSYHVKDDNGNYCYWDAAQGKLIALGNGKNDYTTLTETEKRRATFTTSMNGSIANIPVDYTVEVREVPAGTKYKVEERDYELPDGYTLQWYVTNIESGNSIVSQSSKDPATGIINVISAYNQIEIRNLKGWGLRCYKQWSDEAWMSERDAVYLAVYIDNGGSLTFVDNTDHNTVRRITKTEDSAYWFFQTIQDLDGNSVADESDFARYVVREVIISDDPTVDNMGRVTNYGTVTPLAVDGTGQITLNGKQYGDAASASYTYTVVGYDQGTLSAGSNVRKDTITNKRAGLDLYKTKWDGSTALEGAVFTLTDGSGNAVAEGSFTSAADGLITIAYLRENEVYTLTETASPAGYKGIQTSLQLKRSGNTVSVSNDGGATWQSTVANSADGWYIVDDTDIVSGTNISIGKVSVKNKPYTITIKKTQQTAAGAPLEAAHFALYPQVTGNDGQPRKDFRPITGYVDLVTDGNGIVPQITAAFQNGTLMPGTYYLFEKSPVTGYRPLESDVIFTISNTGDVTLAAIEPSGVELQTVDGADIKYTIVVPNELAGTAVLTVKKLVENGTTADIDAVNKFNYTVRLYLPDGLTQWKVTDTDFDNGVASFTIGHNQTKDLSIPLGAVATVTETANDAYNTTVDSLVATNPNETTSSTLRPFNSSSLTSTIEIDDTKAVTLTYTNTRKTVNVTVNKTVVGSGGEFTFNVTLKDGTTLCQNYTVNNNGTNADTSDDIVTNTSGKATFTLSPAANGTVQKVLKIPYGSVLTVEEADPGYPYQTNVKVGNDSEISALSASLNAARTKGNVTIVFTNTAVYVAPTGFHIDLRPFILMLALGVAMVAMSLMYKRRGRKHRKA